MDHIKLKLTSCQTKEIESEKRVERFINILISC